MELRRLGFSRISFGIQDADPLVQQSVNRVVPVDQLRRAMAWMREAGFASVNVDLIGGLPLQTPERFDATLSLVQDLRPDRVSLFSFAYLPEQLPLQRRIAPEDLPSQLQRLQMLERAAARLGGCGYDAIGMDHYALSGDSLAVAARQGRLHRNFQCYTTGGELELLGVGPTAISQFPGLFSQEQRDLKAYTACIAAGQLPVERGLVVSDPEVLERRELIREVMCHFRVAINPERFAGEWAALEALAEDGLVRLGEADGRGLVEVTAAGRRPLADPHRRGGVRSFPAPGGHRLAADLSRLGPRQVQVSSTQLIVSSKGTALAGSRSSWEVRAARSSGCVMASAGRAVTREAMRVLTHPGQIAVTRMPASHPSLRIDWHRAIRANLLQG